MPLGDRDYVRGEHPPACTCVECTKRRLAQYHSWEKPNIPKKYTEYDNIPPRHRRVEQKNESGCLKLIGEVLTGVIIFGCIFWFFDDFLSIFQQNPPDSTISTTSSIATITTTTPLSTTNVTTSTKSAIVNTTSSVNIVPETTNTSNTTLITRQYSWDYNGSNWTWDLSIYQSTYDYYKTIPRPPTRNYSVYVTHPADDSYINRLAEHIKNEAKNQGFNSYQTVSFTAAFVQSLTYTSDLVTTGFDNYPRYPIETLVDNGGDCEDTAILTAALIDALGYGTVLLVFDGTSTRNGHVAVGVKGGEGIYGTSWTYQDDKYYYLETTGTGWEIGQIPDDYIDSSAFIYPMVPVAVLSHDWESNPNGFNVEIKVTVSNLGSASAENVYVYAGFDAGNDQCWNSTNSPLFDLGVDQTVEATLYLSPPLGKHTRLVIQIVYQGYAVDESYSKWFDT